MDNLSDPVKGYFFIEYQTFLINRMNQITITKATTYDLTIVQQLARETFFETFAEANTKDPQNI